MTRENSRLVSLPFPVNGIDENIAYGLQPEGTTPDAKNVRAFDSLARRLRGGSRPGLTKWFANQIEGTNDILNMNRLTTTPLSSQGLMTDIPIGQTKTNTNQAVTYNLEDGTLTDHFDSTGTTAIEAMFRDYAGNVFVAGERQSTTNYNVWKLGSDLSVTWAIYCDDDSATMYAMAYDPTTHRIAVGGGNGAVSGDQVWILDPDTGDVLDQFDPDSNGNITGLAFDSQGNLYVTLQADTTHNSNHPLSKYDKEMNLVWRWLAKWDANSGDAHYLRTIFIDDSDNVYVGGETADIWDDTEGGTSTTKANIWAFDSDGNLLWNYLTDDGGGDDHANNYVEKLFIPSEADKVYVGKDGGADHENVVKLDISDTTTITEDWTYQISTNAAHQVNAIDEDEDGNIFVGGNESNTWAGAGGSKLVWRLDKDDGSLHTNSNWPIDTGGTIVNDFAFTLKSISTTQISRQSALTLVMSDGDIKAIRDGAVVTPTNGTERLTNTDTELPFSQSAFGKMFFIDGINEVYYSMYDDSDDDEVSLWIPDDGLLPVNPKLMALYRGRMVLSGCANDPHNWYMSKVGDPFDWQYFPTTATVIQAIAGNNSEVGLVGDFITALIPYSDDLMLFGGDHTIWLMSGDPAAGGTLDCLTNKTGIRWGKAWTVGPKGEVFFLGTDGIYRLVPGQSLENITANRIKKKIDDLDLDANYVILEWDYLQQGLMVLVVDKSWSVSSTQTVYFWEERTGAWWEDTYPASMGPLSLFAYDADDPDDKAFLLGCADGYIRKVDFTTDTGDDGTAIDTYVEFPPISEANSFQNTKLTEVNATLGESSGDVDLLLKVAESAERLTSNATTKFKRTLSAGRNRLKPRLTANTVGIELNKSTSTRWAMDSMNGIISSQGRARRIRSS